MIKHLCRCHLIISESIFFIDRQLEEHVHFNKDRDKIRGKLPMHKSQDILGRCQTYYSQIKKLVLVQRTSFKKTNFPRSKLVQSACLAFEDCRQSSK